MAKPKPKSSIDNDLLSQMLKQAEVTNHSLGQTAAPAETAPVETIPEIVAPAASEAPAAAEPAVAPLPETQPAPTALAPVSEPAPADEPTAVETAAETPDATFDLASLFIPTAEKKTFSLRITDRHYQYLLLLGAVVGGGASPPDIIYNLVEQFMDNHDPLVQKAVQKNMRQRQHAAKKK